MADDKKAKKEDEKPEEGKEGAAAEGGEGGEAGAEGGAPDKKAKIKKLVIFVVLPLLILIGGGTGAYFMGAFDKFLPPKPVDCEKVKEGEKGYEECAAKKEAENAAKPGAFVNIPDMIVNLNSNSKQPRFLKVSLKIELNGAEDEKKLQPLLPRVVDQFQMYLRELRIEDLRGTAGIYRMKIELLSRVRAAVPNVKVRDVLFQEILVQ